MKDLKWVHKEHGMQINNPVGLNKRKVDNENGVLFLAAFFAVVKLQRKHIPDNWYRELKDVSSEVLFNLERKVEIGVNTYFTYDRHKGNTAQLMSHDNLTGIVALDLMKEEGNGSHAIRVGEILLNSLFRFDNIQPDRPRWVRLQHPRDYFFYLYPFKPLLSLLFFPIFFISNIITCFTPQEETSGKQLMFVRMEALRGTFIGWLSRQIPYYILRSSYGDDWLNQIMNIYYKVEEHPLRKWTKGLKL